MTKNEFLEKWNNLRLYGTCGSPYYFFINNNYELHIECKNCEVIKLIEYDKLIEFVKDLKKLKKESK